MAVYAITGKLGSGKGKAAIQRLREYLREGKRVATNCDVFMEHLEHDRARCTVLRVPDKPTAADLYMIGSGNRFVEFDTNIVHTKDGIRGFAPLESPRMLPGFDECHNGALVLDECGSWLNTRNFQDKGRAELLEWCIHARKYGWDIFFVMQNIGQIDKQIRDSLFEYVVRLNRLDRMRVPVLSALVKFASAGALSGAMPRVHIAVVRLGSAADGLVADRWIFQGDDLHSAYNTTQVFSDTYPHGTHSLLSPWHLSARCALPVAFVGPCRPGRLDWPVSSRTAPLKAPHPHMTKFLVGSMLLGSLLGAFAYRFFAPRFAPPASAVAVAERKYADAKGVGYFIAGSTITVVLSDGRTIVRPNAFFASASGWEAEISPNLWVRGVGQ